MIVMSYIYICLKHGKLGMLYKNGSVLCNYRTCTVGELADIGNLVAC